MENRSQVEWVSIRNVIPNPLNPRKNDAIKSEEMQEIIKKRGWEEPLTVYKKGSMFVLLAGHRRLYAAKSAGLKEIPVYVVDQPESHQEEIERIASLQSGRVDFTPYEWAKFTYERWLAWGQPPYSSFAKQINLSPASVKQYITVLSYYPRHEIEVALQTKELRITTLDALIKWIRELAKHKPDLVAEMGEDLIRKIMIEKMLSGKVNREALKFTEFCKDAPEESIRDFIIDKGAVLAERIKHLGIEKQYNDFNGHLISLGATRKRVSTIKPETDHQKEMALKALNDLRAQVEQQIRMIER